MGRSSKMKGDPTDDGNAIRAAAVAYFGLASELEEKRAATKETTGGKTKWRQNCVDKLVDPVILADAAELVRKAELAPERTTRDWHIFIGYLKALGFFDHLVPGLFDDFEVDSASESASAAA